MERFFTFLLTQIFTIGGVIFLACAGLLIGRAYRDAKKRKGRARGIVTDNVRVLKKGDFNGKMSIYKPCVKFRVNGRYEEFIWFHGYDYERYAPGDAVKVSYVTWAPANFMIGNWMEPIWKPVVFFTGIGGFAVFCGLVLGLRALAGTGL